MGDDREPTQPDRAAGRSGASPTRGSDGGRDGNDDGGRVRRGRRGHREGRRRWRAGLGAALAAVLAGGGAVAGAGPAAAEWVYSPDGEDGTAAASAGYRISHDGMNSFLGAVKPPVNHPGEIVFCIDGDKFAPGFLGQSSDLDITITDVLGTRMAYVADKYGSDRANALDMAAVSYGLRMYYDDIFAVFEAHALTPRRFAATSAA